VPRPAIARGEQNYQQHEEGDDVQKQRHAGDKPYSFTPT
jgi:hypothetical protein